MTSRWFPLLFAGLSLYFLAWPTTTFSQENNPERQALLKQRDDLAKKANDLLEQGKFANSLACFDQVVELERKLFGADAAEVAERLDFIARTREIVGNYAGARKARQEVLSIQTQRLGPYHWQTTDARLALAHTDLLAKLSYEQRQELQNADGINQQVIALYGQGKYDEAVSLALQVQAIQKKVLGEQHPDYATTLNNLGALYLAKGDYAKSKLFFQQAKAIRLKVLGEKHPNYIATLKILEELSEKMEKK